MKWIYAIIGFFLVLSASAHAADNAFSCSKDDLIGRTPFSVPHAVRGLSGSFTVVFDVWVRPDGTYEDIRFGRSSRNLHVDSAARAALLKTKITGVCLKESEGRLHVQFDIDKDRTNLPVDRITKVWRGPDRNEPFPVFAENWKRRVTHVEN